jgi:hypothetical protein
MVERSVIEREEALRAGEELAKAAAAVANDYAVGDIGDEEDFTGQLIGRLKGKVEQLSNEKIQWRVSAAIEEREDGPPVPLTSVRFSGRQLGAKGPSSEESVIGADMVLVIDINGPDFAIQKGLIIQAKKLERFSALPSTDEQRLRDQCAAMLDRTPASYVLLYSKDGVHCVSAAGIEGCSSPRLGLIDQYPVEFLFADFFLCWIGDPRIKATDRDSLTVLRSMSQARNALLLSATTKTRVDPLGGLKQGPRRLKLR